LSKGTSSHAHPGRTLGSDLSRPQADGSRIARAAIRWPIAYPVSVAIAPTGLTVSGAWCSQRPGESIDVRPRPEGRSLHSALVGAAAERGRWHQTVESASARRDANHLDAVGQKPTEDPVVAYRKVVAVRGTIRLCTVEVGMPSEECAAVV
jgi:hypothetical protein